MAHRTATESGEPWHFVAVGFADAHCLLQLGGKRRVHPLIGVDGEHPLSLGQRQRIVELAPEAFKGMILDTGTHCPRDRHRIVRAAAVDHNAFVGKRHAIEACTDVGGLVLGDDNNAQLRHAIPFCRTA